MESVVEDVHPHLVVVFVFDLELDSLFVNFWKVFTDVSSKSWLTYLGQSCNILVSHHLEKGFVGKFKSLPQLESRIVELLFNLL